MPRFAWIGGPMILLDGYAIGMWLNWDLTPWREKTDDPGIWFGRRRSVETKDDGTQFRRTILALGLVALVRNELEEVRP